MWSCNVPYALENTMAHTHTHARALKSTQIFWLQWYCTAALKVDGRSVNDSKKKADVLNQHLHSQLTLLTRLVTHFCKHQVTFPFRATHRGPVPASLQCPRCHPSRSSPSFPSVPTMPPIAVQSQLSFSAHNATHRGPVAACLQCPRCNPSRSSPSCTKSAKAPKPKQGMWPR